MKAKELDVVFDRGDDITPYLDLSTAKRPGNKKGRGNADYLKNIVKNSELLTKVQQSANKAGLDKMTDAEIDDEIKAYRKKSKS